MRVRGSMLPEHDNSAQSGLADSLVISVLPSFRAARISGSAARPGTDVPLLHTVFAIVF